MKLEHNGDEWHGTFGIALTAMLDDLLSDGEPVKVRVVYESEDGLRQPITDDLRSIEDHWLDFAGGALIADDAVLSVEVL